MKRNLTVTACFAVLIAMSMMWSGCAEIQANLDKLSKNLKSETDRVQSSGQTPLNTPTEDNPVRVTLDGAADSIIDVNNPIFWEVKKPVSANPIVVIRTGAKLGAFQSCIINIYPTNENGTEDQSMSWAITDFGMDPQVIVADNGFNLCQPAPGVSIIKSHKNKADKLEQVELESGKTYIALFAVTGAASSHTHKVRFTVQ
ncbi:hypothetical protein JXA32_04895 [Candidatus Sumerlaeota bacterium]|nr:hypothetical protein [Candidatus Sumerlaeota bacterium]